MKIKTNMREIKFRAFNKEQNKMRNVHSISFDKFIGIEKVGKELKANGKIIDDNFVLMQFTGLQDKNGKDIYEGDVVAIPYIDPMGKLHKETTSSHSKVGFENGQFVIYFIEPEPITDWCEKERGEYVSNYGNRVIVKNTTILEVVGNAYEN